MGLQGTMAIMKKLGVYVSVVNHIVGLVVVEEEESLFGFEEQSTMDGVFYWLQLYVLYSSILCSVDVFNVLLSSFN